jgi:FkbM family methyltransferase
MIRSIIRKILHRPGDTEKLISKATEFGRYKDHEFTFRGLNFEVTDFVSVAWQLKEYFDDGRMKFTAKTDTPVIYDCGANVGVSAIYFKTLYPKAKIKAFEPDQKIFRCLERNIKANHIIDVDLHCKAIWNSNDGVEFGSEGADGGSVYFKNNRILTPSVRLRDLLQKESFIDVLKLDIEGAEIDVLKDCDDELKKVKYLFVEYHSWLQNEQELDVLLNILKKNGFRYYISSIGEVLKQPFGKQFFLNGMDIQLDIYAINEQA